MNLGPQYMYPRLRRDLAELFSHDFSCSSAHMSVENGPTLTRLSLDLCILEGPYRGGHFSFLLIIPETYPFRIVEVWAKHPIFHPNIELATGRVSLPLEWSPVLTLQKLALAVQLMLLEPSADNILNEEAASYSSGDALIFDQVVQRTLVGGRLGNIDFPNVLAIDCPQCLARQHHGLMGAKMNYDDATMHNTTLACITNDNNDNNNDGRDNDNGASAADDDDDNDNDNDNDGGNDVSHVSQRVRRSSNTIGSSGHKGDHDHASISFFSGKRSLASSNNDDTVLHNYGNERKKLTASARIIASASGIERESSSDGDNGGGGSQVISSFQSFGARKRSSEMIAQIESRVKDLGIATNNHNHSHYHASDKGKGCVVGSPFDSLKVSSSGRYQGNQDEDVDDENTDIIANGMVYDSLSSSSSSSSSSSRRKKTCMGIGSSVLHSATQQQQQQQQQIQQQHVFGLNHHHFNDSHSRVTHSLATATATATATPVPPLVFQSPFPASMMLSSFQPHNPPLPEPPPQVFPVSMESDS